MDKKLVYIIEDLFRLKKCLIFWSAKKNLKVSKKTSNSRLFIAYYLNNVRLIDNI